MPHLKLRVPEGALASIDARNPCTGLGGLRAKRGVI